MGKNQFVTHRDDGYWQVMGEGNKKPTVVVETQREAISIATDIAKNQKSELTICGRDGKIRKKALLVMTLYRLTADIVNNKRKTELTKLSAP